MSIPQPRWTLEQLAPLEFVPDAIIVVNLSGRVIFANSYVQELFGYAPEELIDQPIEVLIPGASRDAHRDQRAAYNHQPRHRRMGARTEFVGLHRDGRELPVEISLNPLQTESGPAVMTAVRDASERWQVQEALRNANTRLRADLRTAARIQRGLLPTIPPQVEAFEFAWWFEPCERLAGDSFNVFAVDPSFVGLYLLDVCGHGVSAAMQALALARVLSQIPWPTSALRDIRTPASVVKRLNNEFQMDPETWQYFTFLCAGVDAKRRELRYVTAGHPWPVRIPADGEPQTLEAGGLPIGLFPDVEYEEYVVSLRPGDRIFFYSDGVTEAMNGEEEDFGRDRLLEVLGRTRGEPLATSLSVLISELREWCGTDALEDDVSAVAFEVRRDATTSSTP